MRSDHDCEHALVRVHDREHAPGRGYANVPCRRYEKKLETRKREG
jgi:hypothetical protein